jgi:hypothetical protein
MPSKHGPSLAALMRDHRRFAIGMSQVWTLEREGELRLIADEGASVKLVEGSAEVFGVELAPGVVYRLRKGKSVAVFSWFGAKVWF